MGAVNVKIRDGVAYVEIHGEPKKLVTMKKIPDNAFLIDVSPPRWVQIGNGTFIITNGALWLDEEPGDTVLDEGAWKYDKELGAWKIPYLPGVYEEISFKDGRVFGENMKCRENEYYCTWWKNIFERNGEIITMTDEEIVSKPRWSLETFAKVDKYYVPVASLGYRVIRILEVLMNGKTDFEHDGELVKSETLGIILVGKGGALVQKRKVPENAVLIDTNPLHWIQFGKGRFLITRGIVWLDESADATFEEGFEWYYDDEKDCWRIKIDGGLPFAGKYCLKNSQLVEEGVAARKNYVFSGKKNSVALVEDNGKWFYRSWNGPIDASIVGKYVEVQLKGRVFLVPWDIVFPPDVLYGL